MTTTAARIGIYAPISHPFGLPPVQDVLGFLTAVDEGPFDSVWVGDHLLWHGPLLESTATLAAIAAITRQVTIGTNIYLPALRPALVSARTMGTIDYLSGGRLILGLGLGGENGAEFEALGLDVRKRRGLFDKALDEILDWWSSDAPAGNGAVAAPVCAHPRLWIGGRSEPALRRTVDRRAAAWSAHLMSPQRVAASREMLHAYASERGLPAPEIAVTVFVDLNGGRGDDGRRFLRAHFGDGSERLLQHVVAGSVVRCVEQIASYLPVADHILLFPANAHPWEQTDDLTAVAHGLGARAVA